MPICSPLFVDKISLTLAVEDAGAIGRIQESVLHEGRVGGFPFIRAQRDDGYRHSREIVFDNDCKVLVQCSPRRRSEQGRGWPLRLEWNPAKLGSSVEYHAAYLSILNGWFRDALEREMWRATITRIDFAIDIRGLNVNRLVVARTDATVKSSLHLGRDGQLESNYLGSMKDSRLLYLIYDKRTERGGRVHGGGFERTRIEARVKNRLSVPGLWSMLNPFAKLTIREFREMEISSGGNGRYQWDWFIDSCRVRGLEAALNLISNARTRQIWRNRVVELESPDWWSPEEIWGGLHDAIEQLGLFHRPSRIRRRLQ